MKIFSSIVAIIFIKEIIAETLVQKGWESICSVLSCKPVLDNCIRKNCIGKDECRSCVQSENQICMRCFDSLINEQYFTINGNQTIICDQVNDFHQTTCNFFCRIKGSIAWKCEQFGGYPLCNCEIDLITTKTSEIPTSTATTISTTPIPSLALIGNISLIFQRIKQSRE
jgi:hypothetical protein